MSSEFGAIPKDLAIYVAPLGGIGWSYSVNGQTHWSDEEPDSGWLVDDDWCISHTPILMHWERRGRKLRLPDKLIQTILKDYAVNDTALSYWYGGPSYAPPGLGKHDLVVAVDDQHWWIEARRLTGSGDGHITVSGSRPSLACFKITNMCGTYVIDGTPPPLTFQDKPFGVLPDIVAKDGLKAVKQDVLRCIKWHTEKINELVGIMEIN